MLLALVRELMLAQLNTHRCMLHDYSFAFFLVSYTVCSQISFEMHFIFCFLIQIIKKYKNCYSTVIKITKYYKKDLFFLFM